MKDIAKEFHQQRRGNCAQSVAFAWRQAHPEGAEADAAFARCGGGRAPEGLCGAVHASCTLAGAAASESIKQAFMERTGGCLACKDLRAAKRAPCNECVEIAAELLERFGNPSPKW